MRMQVGDNGGQTAKIFLDNIEVHDCIEANEEDGYVIVHAKDGDGNLLISSYAGGSVITKKIYGTVRIELEEFWIQFYTEKQKAEEKVLKENWNLNYIGDFHATK